MRELKYSYELKKEIVLKWSKGLKGYALLGKEYNIPKRTIKEWCNLYSERGLEGLTPKIGKYSQDFKLNVIKYVVDNKVSYTQAAAIFKLSSHSIIKSWMDKYKVYGEPIYTVEPPRRSPAMKKKNISILKKEPKAQSNEYVKKLEEELEFLKAENAYLKKLKALTQQKLK